MAALAPQPAVEHGGVEGAEVCTHINPEWARKNYFEFHPRAKCRLRLTSEGNQKSRSRADRIMARIEQAEAQEQNPHLRCDYRIAFFTVLYAASGDARLCSAHVLATYRVLSCHPDQVWQRIQARRKATLGNEYCDLYDENGNLRPQHLDIPDFDPTSELASHVQAPQPCDRGKYAWPKAPLRRVVSRTEAVGDRGAIYHLEQLECGHSHTEFPDANPPRRRRRCPECQKLVVAQSDIHRGSSPLPPVGNCRHGEKRKAIGSSQ
jgi:hypothetical protein